MTEPQVWVLITVFAAATFTMIGVVTAGFNRTPKASIDGVRVEIAGLREPMNARFETMDVKFSRKFELLDRDIQALSRRVFGDESRSSLLARRAAPQVLSAASASPESASCSLPARL